MPQFLKDILGNTYGPQVLPLVHIATVLFLALVVLKLSDSALKRLRLWVPTRDVLGVARAEQRAETLSHIVRSVVKFALIVFVGLTISSELGFDIGPLLASVGIAGVAIGFGAQSLVKDVISGFFILLEDQYGVGDVIKIGQFSGVVEHMSLRATVLRNLEGQVHVIPNGTISAVTVMTKEWARSVVDVTIGYREDLGKVFRVLEQIGDSLHQDWPDRVSERPTILGVEQMDSNGVTIRCMTKTLPMKHWEVTREWRRRIKEEFERQGIEFPVPQQMVLIQENVPKQAPQMTNEN
jgi:small conductance mechanosensitive channel